MTGCVKSQEFTTFSALQCRETTCSGLPHWHPFSWRHFCIWISFQLRYLHDKQPPTTISQSLWAKDLSWRACSELGHSFSIVWPWITLIFWTIGSEFLAAVSWFLFFTSVISFGFGFVFFLSIMLHSVSYFCTEIQGLGTEIKILVPLPLPPHVLVP